MINAKKVWSNRFRFFIFLFFILSMIPQSTREKEESTFYKLTVLLNTEKIVGLPTIVDCETKRCLFQFCFHCERWIKKKTRTDIKIRKYRVARKLEKK